MAEALTTEPTGGQLAGVQLAQAAGQQQLQSLRTQSGQAQTILDENRKRLRDMEAAIRRAQRGKVVSNMLTFGGIVLGAGLAAPAIAAAAAPAAGAAGAGAAGTAFGGASGLAGGAGGLGAAAAAPALTGSAILPGALSTSAVGAGTGAGSAIPALVGGGSPGVLSRLGLSMVGGAKVGAKAGNVLGSLIGGQQADPAFGDLLNIAQGIQQQRQLSELTNPQRASVLDEALRELQRLQAAQAPQGATL